jgi:hypothetical protein
VVFEEGGCTQGSRKIDVSAQLKRFFSYFFLSQVVRLAFVDFQRDEIWNKILFGAQGDGRLTLSDAEVLLFETLSFSKSIQVCLLK